MNALWAWLDRRTGRLTPPRTKVFIGFLIATLAIVLMAVAGALAGPDGRISVWWIVMATLVITVAELCIVVVGLQMAFSDAPPRLKSTVTALFWLTVFAGNLIAAAINQLYGVWPPGAYFALQAVLIGVAGALFYLIGFRLAPVRAVPSPAQ
jgi:POT family proton-dependent oligopeptide transporter